MRERAYLGVDVGTGSVRAALFDGKGVRLGMGVHPIQIWRPAEDFVEQSSDDIWRAAAQAIGAALREAALPPDHVRGIGFDATCSLVALDAAGAPVSVSPTHSDEQNVIVWMDHRATEQARAVNQTGHEVLQYVGGTISPEMQIPKLLWLKQHAPRAWQRSARFFDLADFMTYRATGSDARSLCTTVCKWTHLGHERRFDDEFLSRVGLDDLVRESYQRIGQSIRPLGQRAGVLTETAARELGLTAGTPVGIGIIDAHAGGVGMLATRVDDNTSVLEVDDTRLALIGGTSSCHMAVSREARFVPGVWGPYFSAMIPELWLTEGGQSATGALIDHVIHGHARSPELEQAARTRGCSVQTLLNEHIEALASSVRFEAELATDMHVLPDFHGNRSPRADPSLRGVISGLKLSDSVEQLALVYWATLQAIAHGTRHIVDTLNAHGYRIDTLIACGGDTKNPKFLKEHADITGCRVILPREPEAVLLGSAMLGALASGDFAELTGSERAELGFLHVMSSMSAAGAVIEPERGEVARFHAKKHAVFQRMHADFLEWRRLMA